MSALIYRKEDGSLAIGTDAVSDQVVAAVYRSGAGKEIVLDEDTGVFVEKTLDGSRSVNLFAAS